ncbi:sensor histidine kinase [Deinococcus gobiensis]|uniref:Putative signal transduction histidine kinase n=1 Tax=Deinococcus gobiensis (strain DSM 21396 / JCM 16679 / CGMCC 1.7299 / I-0) TaxID=745776 RepID=H8GTY3_DEIGI|nr:sensor histidine kinase [Deinococcus gobiensis]AFD26623.1 Putative signal transduction histidine kinase [Deinococcus gobiensis I-0]
MSSMPRRFWELFPLFWLMFLAYPVSGFVQRAHPPGETALFWAVLAGFVVLYVLVFRRGREGREYWSLIGWVGALLAYGVTFRLSDGGASAFLVYAGALVGYQSRAYVALWGSLLAALVMALPLWSGQYGLDDLPWIVVNMVFTLVTAYANHAGFLRHVAQARVAQLQREQERLAAEAERERIARDLHDLLGHTLSVIVLKSELASRLAERAPAQAAAEIREVERISREALHEVRAAVRGYQGSGLTAELARAKVALDTAGVALRVGGPLPELPREVEATAAMLLREAVTNVVRHARAHEVQVKVEAGPRGYVLEIRDDGVGGQAPEGSGLTGMRERVRAIGGTLERDGRGGTRLRAQFPVLAGRPVPAAPAAVRA